MTAVLLDTHVLVWLVNGDSQLSAQAQQHILAAPQVWVSAITPWEIAMLVAKQRLTLTKDVLDWIAQALALPGVRLAATCNVPVTPGCPEGETGPRSRRIARARARACRAEDGCALTYESLTR